MPNDFLERQEDVNAVKEGLLQSKNIFNLLANLYFICASQFTKLDNLIEAKIEKEKFLHYHHTFKQELSEIISQNIFTTDFRLEILKQDIFTTDFQKVIGVLKRVNGSSKHEYLIIAWAFLKSIDWAVSDNTIYLDNMKTVRSSTSAPFEAKTYRLLFKPNNLILDTIKNKLPGSQLKTGIDIGQRIEDQLQKIIMFEELPSRRIEFKSADKKVNDLLTGQGQNLAFAVAPICYDYDYTFKPFQSDEGVSYVFDEIKNRQEIIRIIDALLRRCIQEDLHIVVFPELAIDGQMREYISDWLKINNTDGKIIMVIAGSYHMLKDKREETYENNCIVYRFDGNELWVQKKMNRFQLVEDDIKEVISGTEKGFQEFKKLFKETDRRGYEHIEISDTLVLYDSPIGRMAVTICLDFIVKENVRLLIDPQVNIIFLPAMSLTLEKMRIANVSMGNFGDASVFCANNCWIITGGEKGNFKPKQASYIYLPHKNGIEQLKCNEDSDCVRCELKILRISGILERESLRAL